MRELHRGFEQTFGLDSHTASIAQIASGAMVCLVKTPVVSLLPSSAGDSNCLRRPAIRMMEPTEYRARHDRTVYGARVCRGSGDGLSQPLVRSIFVEIRRVLTKHSEQMSLAQNDHVIQALPPRAPKESLAKRIHVRRADGRLQDLDS